MFFFYPVLDALSDGRVIRRVVQGILKVSAWILAALGILAVIQILKEGLRSNETLATVGSVLFAIVVLAWVACVFQACYYRSLSIDELGPSEYTVIPIVSILCRLTGEVLTTLFVALAVGLCLLSWLGAATGSPLAWAFGRGPLWSSENNFVVGLSLFGWFLLMAMGTILLFYFLAEAVVVLADIARHTRRLAAGAAPEVVRSAAARPAGPAHARPSPGSDVHPPPSPSAAEPPPAPPAATRAGSPLCSACGARNESGSAFCAECGSAL
jgi:hypothetical protein